MHTSVPSFNDKPVVVCVRCHDMGEPRMSTNKTLILNVVDVNDNAPLFDKDVYLASLPENSPWGSFVVRISASDPDSGQNGEIAYMIEESESARRFHVDPDTGVITTLAELDRETTATLDFNVLAANKGEHNLVSRALVRVRLIDVDDEAPVFLTKEYHFEVPENLPSRNRIGQVYAIDRDMAPYNAFSYRLDSGSNEFFFIEPTSGAIFTKRVLDRESRDSYELTVEAISNTVAIKNDSAAVTISVLDINDNSPIFLFPVDLLNDTTRCFASLPVGEIVTTVRATDLDSGVNAELRYDAISGNFTGYFTVESISGNVLLLSDMSEFINNSFALTVRARDSGQPELFTTATLYILIVEGILKTEGEVLSTLYI